MGTGALLGTLLVVATSPVRAQAARGTALDQVVDSAAAHGFSGLVLVGAASGAGAPTYERAVGVADRGTGRRLRTDDVWRWASVTKQVTAALVLRQVDLGRLALDSPVVRYLPDFAGPTAGTVTLRQLLQHTSGLPNPDDAPAGADGIPAFYRATGAAAGHAGAVRGYCAGTPRRPPGAAFEYNNCDYLVLGAVLERVTGRSYAALVREQVADALGARSVRVAADGTGFGPRGTTVPGYLEGGGPEAPQELSAYGAAGALSGTARDLLAFDRALAGHRLVSPAGTAEMWRGDARLGYAALGAWVFPAPLRGCAGPVELVERRGEIGGVQVRNVIAPALDRVLVVFTNDARVQFGEVWQGRGLSHALLSAAFCPAPAAP